MLCCSHSHILVVKFYSDGRVFVLSLFQDDMGGLGECIHTAMLQSQPRFVMSSFHFCKDGRVFVFSLFHVWRTTMRPRNFISAA